MYIGDVGGAREEVTYLPRASSAGANLGWNCHEGDSPAGNCTARDIGHLSTCIRRPATQ